MVVEKFGSNEDEEYVKNLGKWSNKVVDQIEKAEMRKMILKEGIRLDGRKTDEIRPIECEIGLLPRTHGSALFTRGETQSLTTMTLGTDRDEQMIDGLLPMSQERFMLHYNFPPYSVGETGRMGSPGRREIGHGKLAWRAVHPLLPPHHEFPYTLRVVSEVTESNGSSSMATVCGGTLALMDAGVPITRTTLPELDRFSKHRPHKVLPLGGPSLCSSLTKSPSRTPSSLLQGFLLEASPLRTDSATHLAAPPAPHESARPQSPSLVVLLDGVEDPQRAEESVLQDNSWRRLLVSLDGALRPNPLLAWASPLEREKSELESAAAAATRGVSPSLVESGALFDALGSLQFYVDFWAADRLLSQSEGQ